MSRGTIALFAKPPRPGVSKTRLIPAVGADGSAALARSFLRDTYDAIGRFRVRRVVATPEIDRRAMGLGPRTTFWLQGDGDLGDRMARILARACADGPWGIVVGADVPGLPFDRVDRAIAALGHFDAVVVPSHDGGFVLLGMRTVPEGILAGLPWSVETTLEATVARLRGRGLSVRILDPFFDVDTPDDLVILRRWLADHPDAAPATRSTLARLGRLDPVRLSVVIPTWNEADRIAATVRHTLDRPGVDEVIVSDGGSDDGTADRIAGWDRVRVVTCAKGRGPQLNAGAAAADGEILLFLHADCRLPDDAGPRIEAALADRRVVGGAFKLWTVPDGGPRASAWWMHLADLRSRFTRHPYGDQALFCRREAFAAVGGFPDIPIMEDYALSRALADRGRLARVDARVTASGRRFAAHPLYYFVVMNVFPSLYRLGVPPERLAAWYPDER